MDYGDLWKRVEEACRRSPDAERFLMEILSLWAEYGIVEGEWCCLLEEAV